MEEKKESRVCEEDVVITKNPMFYLQQGIRAILKCLGFESSKLVDHQSSSSSSLSMSDTNKKEEESEKQEQECDGIKQGSDSTNGNYKNGKDPPQSQTPIEAETRRGNPPQRPPIGRGSPPQNN